MAILVRLFVVASVTVLCIVVFAALFEMLHAARTELTLGALWWGVIFRAPVYLFTGTVPLLIVLAVAEWRAMKAWLGYLAIWCAAGLLATGRLLSSPLGLFAALAAAAAAGTLYWLFAGKFAGDWRQVERWQRNGGFKLLNYAAYVFLAYLAYQLAGYVYYGGKLVWVTYISEPGPGMPPFQTKFDRRPTASQKVAMMDFPNPESCLKRVETEALPSDRLKEMDWDRIDNSDEADVCMFRLLGSYENLSYATDWLEAQGFDVGDKSSSARPYIAQDGRKLVHAGYSIRKKGPKFPTRGIIRRAFGSIPYGMSVDATWSQDGTQLLSVVTGFSTL